MGVVKKFGGTVFQTDDSIKKLAAFLAENYNPDEDMIIVVSALEGESRRLETLGINFGGVHIGREIDQLIALGEQRTANLLTLSLKSKGVPAVSLNGFQLGIRTTSQHGKSAITSIKANRVEQELNLGKVVVATGFQGLDEEGDITTFGANYGGSDLTAVVLAIAMNYECELYKKVSGVYSVDPKKYEKGKVIPEIAYSEMMELSACGAEVIEPKAVELAAEFGLKVYVGKAFEENKGGTYLMKDSLVITNKAITSLGIEDDVAMCTIRGEHYLKGTTTRIFEELGKAKVNLDIIIKQKFEDGKWGISFSCETKQMAKVKDSLEKMKKEYNFDIAERQDLVVLSIVGIGMATSSGVALRAFNALAAEGVDVLNVTTSEISISFVMEVENKMKGIVALCEEFDL